jgi:hypothetical protein
VRFVFVSTSHSQQRLTYKMPLKKFVCLENPAFHFVRRGFYLAKAER